jgi:hypothetical protein
MSSTTTPPTVHAPATVTSSVFSVVIEATTQIRSPAADVWDVVADAAAYGEWSPFVTSLDDPIVAGARSTVVLRLGDRKPQTLRPRIVDLVPGRAFEWHGTLGLPGLLDGRHRFEVRPTEEGACEFVHRERLTGLLVPLVRGILTGPTPEAFVAHNVALRDRVERSA